MCFFISIWEFHRICFEHIHSLPILSFAHSLLFSAADHIKKYLVAWNVGWSDHSKVTEYEQSSLATFTFWQFTSAVHLKVFSRRRNRHVLTEINITHILSHCFPQGKSSDWSRFNSFLKGFCFSRERVSTYSVF